MASGFARMLALSRDFRRKAPAITVNGRVVYWAVVRRWPGYKARQKTYAAKKSNFHL